MEGMLMNAVLSYLGVTTAEFWVGAFLVVFALVILLAALRPDREFADLPRGVFPAAGSSHSLQRARRTEPPLRAERPEMTIAEGAYAVRDASTVNLSASILIDLAVRGFIELVEYQHLTAGHPAIMIVYRRPPDSSCSPEERALLELLSTPGAAESPEYARTHPFNARLFRNELETAGIPLLGEPTARVSGLRVSAGTQIAARVRREVTDRRAWFASRHEHLGTVGAIELVSGGLALVFTFVLAALGALRPYWLAVSALVTIMGLFTVRGYGVRTAYGVVARDQTAGFRRFLVEAPPERGASVERLAKLAAWALVLSCVREWAQSLERLGRAAGVPAANSIETLLPWAQRSSVAFQTWQEVADFIELINARTHADTAASDADSPLDDITEGWGRVPSNWI
ncbi:MAG: DUF2207 domain-containing protein [Actinomycetaceae bacterium]|nr:DUF2207 domain-containing protein [Actinomycetaceae bacterium]